MFSHDLDCEPANATVNADFPTISAIAAISRNGALGLKGGLPWDILEDVAYFEGMVAGAAQVVGRLTYHTMPTIPADTFVVSQQTDLILAAGAHRVATVEEGLLAALATGKPVFVIGGAAIYQAAWPYCRYLYLTRFDQYFEGDVFFPENIDLSRLTVLADATQSYQERRTRQAVDCRFTFFEQKNPLFPQI